MRTTTDGNQLDKHFGKINEPSSRLTGATNQRQSTNFATSIGMQRGINPNSAYDLRHSENNVKPSPFKIFESAQKIQPTLQNPNPPKPNKPEVISTRFSFSDEQNVNLSPEHARNRNKPIIDPTAESQNW